MTTILILALACSFSMAPVNGAASEGMTLKFLTLNLLFSEPDQPRFEDIADFIHQEAYDCILFQEVVGGELAKTLGLTQSLNSALELKKMLSNLGDDYQVTYRLANGIPLLFSVGNASFCRNSLIDIEWTVSRTLSFASEITINDVDIKLRRIIMASLLDVTGFGNLLLFNTHLCAFCPAEQRQVQIEEALEFIRVVRNWVRWMYGNVPCVFGGDFNISDNGASDGMAFEAYESIIDAGFTDAYAQTNACFFGTCCTPVENPTVIEPGCTYAVDDNPFVGPDSDQTTRIDYFFLMGLQPVSTQVVFNELDNLGPFVSDHSGVEAVFEH